MLRILLAAAIALPIAASHAETPASKAIAQAAKTCTVDGAFGRRFSEAEHGHVNSIADDEWTPFRRLVLSTDGNGAPLISAEASFYDAGETHRDDVGLARRFFHALDKAITAKHRFPHREARGNGVTFHTTNEPDAGLVFDIHQEGDRVIADCVDLGIEPSRQELSRPERPDNR